jgi:D-arabinose 1-dehydrogenase-like Zn-dependent alcohol dehydrogenase
VTEVGSKVENFKVDDKVGVGCLVGSCRSCQDCDDSLENYCTKFILTYGAKYSDGSITYGGYSDSMVVDERFVIHIPNALPLDVAAPLLCARITVYSPLIYYGLNKPVKFAKAFGVNVTVISTSPNKKKEALEHLKADSFLNSRDPDQMQVNHIYTSMSMFLF